MAVEYDDDAIVKFDAWYTEYGVDADTGCLSRRANLSPKAVGLIRMFEKFKREMDSRCQNYDKLEKMADGEVISPKPDLPNVSSGETAGLVRRIARNLVQNAPNVEVISVFDDQSMYGIFSRHILLSKVIGSDQYSNDMQQNLFSSTKQALTIGFDCVVPVLLQDAAKSWYIDYDTIHYRDVFPEPGAKDVRKATQVFVRRYLTKGEIKALIQNQTIGWDIVALKTLLRDHPRPPHREFQSNARQDTKRGAVSEGYEIITWYSSGGRPFLTWSVQTKHLLRVEKNKHPMKQHPVFFLVLEKDAQQPLGKSQVELLLGRQEFQDLMHNGAMKLWYRNINPSILGFGAGNALPNLSPGKYTNISNPNGRIEAFEVNTQTLLQYSSISQGNLGAMVNLLGSADQQMATQAGSGMSATPQGVEAQQAMVDITTNNYQKAIESFFSHYCSYALTIYFQELKSVKKVTPSAEARQALLGAGIDKTLFNDQGELSVDFSDLAVEYFVRCVPGSLVEMEDEKQLRILNQLFVPLSQALPAIAETQDIESLRKFTAAMEFIVMRQIELSGSNRASQLKKVLLGEPEVADEVEGIDALDEQISSFDAAVGGIAGLTAGLVGMQEQIGMLRETQGLILQKLGVAPATSALQGPTPEEDETTGR